MNFKKCIVYICVFCVTLFTLNVYAESKNSLCKVSKSERTHVDKIKNHDSMLILDGTKNTRYLGIYNDRKGNPLNRAAFLRSDNTGNLSESDLEKLKKLNLKTVIDLRYPPELAKTPDKFADVDWVKYHNITIAVNRKKYSLYDSYINALECKKQIKNIFETIANAEEGTILFHCAYGKDRTGILAMLLLGVANVENEYIIENYSECYLFDCSKRNYKRERKKTRRNMKKVIKYIIDKYKSFDNYILSTGLSEENLSKVKERINPGIVKALENL